MRIVERMRGLSRWLSAARGLARLRRGDPPPRTDAPGAPGAPTRPPVERPPQDPALLSRLGRWRRHDGPLAPPTPARMNARERAAAMRDLQILRGRLGATQAATIDAAIESGAVTVRRLGPGDGHVWEMSGMRVFAIVGVQAFTVEEPTPPPSL